jgi:uncharacterized protein YodC (DUF2158 family)
MNKKINIGDVVKLKSGGVPMTVMEVYLNDEDEDDTVDLVWHDVHGQLCEADHIPIACLVAVST